MDLSGRINAKTAAKFYFGAAGGAMALLSDAPVAETSTQDTRHYPSEWPRTAGARYSAGYRTATLSALTQRTAVPLKNTGHDLELHLRRSLP